MSRAVVDVSNPPSGPGWHHALPLRVYWEDTDAGGIVFYGNYLKFMERARTEWFRALGFSQQALKEAGEGMFVVAETQLRYLRPARLDDALTVTVAVTEVKRATVQFEQTVRRGDQVLCQGVVRIGWVKPVARTADTDGEPFRSARIPEHILAALPAPLPASGG